ncbi:hypothetical protein SeMB42_g02668 [Synchytrium endobioticum]|uniref:Ubiquitin-conjugating enzyme E2-binding protein n=1 Tax=Synchytrium endobioticum TaxID=286115 RepID=A0A507DBK4_9FUNG|nr:hypothetical protein SeLEV6574_g02119 [Synchytrium endobioticum]TPX49270.1 hypothetical protein SeMB42_g02668 [Synchytrium endobioticum]
MATILDTNSLEFECINPYTALSLKLCHRITCRGCHAELLTPPGEQNATVATEKEDRFKRILDLPSTYWHEVVDCWMCHTEDYSKMITPNGWLHPKSKGDLLVGSAFVVLHDEDIRIDAIQTVKLTHQNQTSRLKSPWKSFKCKNCALPLGETVGFHDTKESEAEAYDENANQASFKLYKYAVDFWMQTDQPGAHYTFPVYLAHDLLESASSNASYRHVIWSFRHDEDVKAIPFMLLWLLNPDVRIGSINLNSGNGGRGGDLELRCRPALKVLYMDCRGSLDSVSAKIRSSWLSSKTIERLTFPIPQCTELLTTLDESATEYIPQSKRTLNGLNVGYLFVE